MFPLTSPKYARNRCAAVPVPIVIAVRTPAFARNDQWTHPVAASSEYTNPVSAPTKTRPPTTDGCPYAELPFGKPNAHFSANLGTSAAVRPGWV